MAAKAPPAAVTAATAAPRGILMDVVMSVFEPGTNTGLIKAMNFSFYALFATLLCMIVGTGGNVHVCALFALSVGLFLSIKWFLIQIADVEEQRRLEREAEGTREDADTKGKGKTE